MAKYLSSQHVPRAHGALFLWRIQKLRQTVGINSIQPLALAVAQCRWVFEVDQLEKMPTHECDNNEILMDVSIIPGKA